MSPIIYFYLISLRFQRFLDHFFANSNPTLIKLFLSFHNFDSSFSITSNKRYIYSQLSQLSRLVSYIEKKLLSKSSSWSSYDDFHDINYRSKKLDLADAFISASPKTQPIIDLGSNNTLSSTHASRLIIPFDLDIVVTNRLSKTNPIVICNDLVEALLSSSDSSVSLLTVNHTVTFALFLGIFHHLVITYSLPADYVFFRLSQLYSELLIEIPDPSDPLVEFLSRSREDFKYQSVDHYISLLQKYFMILRKVELSNHRSLLWCKSI